MSASSSRSQLDISCGVAVAAQCAANNGEKCAMVADSTLDTESLDVSCFLDTGAV